MTMQQRLRSFCETLRRTPTPIENVIPMLQQAADTLDKRDAEAKRLAIANHDNATELQERIDALKAELAKRDAEIATLTDVMAFIERWANHHAPKPHMDAEQALSVIQHHPSIKAITHKYSDGKVPETHDPYAEIVSLKLEVEQLTKKYEALQQAYGLMHGGSK